LFENEIDDFIEPVTEMDINFQFLLSKIFTSFCLSTNFLLNINYPLEAIFFGIQNARIIANEN